jgi:hypothetical protein
MAFQYVNRSGDAYFLQSMSRAGGKRSYSFTRKLRGEPVDALPEGHEVYERPEDGQVFLRRARPSAIRPEERQLAESSIRALADGVHAIVRAEGKAIIVYLADIEPDARLAILRVLAPMGPADADRLRQGMLRRAGYDKMLRFTLTDPARRRFNAERWCFLGSIDDWYFLDGDKPLPELLEATVPHLGKESFFELM